MSTYSHDDLDAFDRDLLAADDARSPSDGFVSQLRFSLRSEAQALEAAPSTPSRARPALRAVPQSTPMATDRELRTNSGRWVSLGLVAAVLLMMVAVAALTWQPSANDPTTVPAGYAASPSPELAALPDVPMPGANPARTGVQPGPGLTGLPEIVQQTDTGGNEMALADGVLYVMNGLDLRALDVNSLVERWSLRLPGASYSAPMIADGRIYLGFSRNTESAGQGPDDNGLVALSALDGHELWRIAGGGIYPVSPIAIGDVVYSVGLDEHQYVLGAFSSADGEPRWQVGIAPFEWCCPSVGIAYADGLIAVSTLDHAAVYDSADGRELWADQLFDSGHAGQSSVPLIVGDLVVVTASTDEREGGGPPEVGATTAYDLRTGEVRWANDQTRSYQTTLAAPGDVIYAGAWFDAEGGSVARLSVETGEPIWRIPIPGTTNEGIAYQVHPNVFTVVVGDTVYVTGAIQPRPGAMMGGGLVSAIDLESGTVRWSAQIDDPVSTAPIISDGRIYVISNSFGLLVLEDAQSRDADTSTAVDLRTPLICSATRSESPLLGELPAEPSIPAMADRQQLIGVAEIPAGTGAVEPALAEQLEARFNEYRACTAIDPDRSLFGFFSADFYVRLRQQTEIAGRADLPEAVEMAGGTEFLALDTTSLRMLPDGRIGGLISSANREIFVWFVNEDGEWKIDEYHPISWGPLDANVATPGPESTPLD